MKNDSVKCKIGNQNANKIAIFSLFFTLFFTFSFLFFNFSSAATSSDAIAIRVIPNPNHYSPLRWYTEKGFSGSPQSLAVDGFEAVRDGRTVYVNAANVVDTGSDGEPDTLYTNIYLLSYTQEAEGATVDIFGQILSHWKFNTNIAHSGSCNKEASKICSQDSECGDGDYCAAPKAKIIRDTKRLADLADFKTALENYKNKNGKYPVLPSGSYMPNTTISVWPSWQDVFGEKVGAHLPVDPVNRLGECGGDGFDSRTCWNENTKKFADPILSNGAIDLPEGSSAYIYTSASDGSKYDLFLSFETAFTGGGSGTVGGNSSNGAPVLSCGTLSGYPHIGFSGFVGAGDPEGDALRNWVLTPVSPANWSDWGLANEWVWDALKSELALSSTNVPNLKKISAQKAGREGDYIFRVSVSDVKGNIADKECTINIKEDIPYIDVNNATFDASSTKKIDFVLKARQVNTKYYSLTHSLEGTWPLTMSGNFSLAGSEYIYLVTGKLSPLNTFNSPNTIHNFTSSVADDNGVTGTANFNVTITNTPPSINDFKCSESVSIGKSYSCVINAIDKESNRIIYSFEGLPAGLSGDVDTGDITGSPTVTGVFNISITPTDEFGYSGITKNIKLAVLNAAPVLGHISCPKEVRMNMPYQCVVEATDQDGHSITYSFSGLPAGLSGNSDTGVISGAPTVNGVYDFSVTPADQFGAIGVAKTLRINIKTFCGDGVAQSVNDENVNEMCDDGNPNNDDSCTNSCEWTCRSSVIPDFMSAGKGDGILYGNNSNTTVLPTDTSISPFTYLKLSGVLPTPYIWVANTGTDKISKIRTNNGLKRICQDIGDVKDCFWQEGTWETRGQIIGTYDVGDDPSRTAVNIETGDVWVGNRNGYSVTKLDNEGSHKKTCGVGGVVRGVAIEESGDVWVASHSGARVVKISGDDSNCAILQSISISPHAPYGLSIDEDGILWVVVDQSGVDGVIKINPATETFTHYPSSGGYGITIDFDKNIWLGGHAGHALIKFNQTSLSTPQYYGPGHSGLGVTIDIDGNIWASTYTENSLMKFTKDGTPVFNVPSGGSDAHGACGDSYGQVWVVNHASGNLRAYDLSGTNLGTFNAYPGTVPTNAYTYSDMTGLNRAMLLRSGNWTSNPIDSGFPDQHWGAIEFQQSIPSSRQKVEIFVRSNNDSAALDTTLWKTIGDWNSDTDGRLGRFMQVKIKMRSNQRLVSPAVWDLKTTCN